MKPAAPGPFFVFDLWVVFNKGCGVMNTGGLGTESPGFWMQGLASPLMYVCAGQEQGSVHLGI